MSTARASEGGYRAYPSATLAPQVNYFQKITSIYITAITQTITCEFNWLYHADFRLK